MCIHRLSRQAKQDLREILAYLKQINPTVARRTLDAIQQTFDRLAEHPGLGTSLSRLCEGLRYFVPGKPSQRYVVLYYPIENGVEISNVFHQSRDWWQLIESGER